MKKKQHQELKEKSLKELEKLAKEVEKKLIQLKVDWGAGKLKNVHQIGKKRRELAMIKNIFRQKELAGELKEANEKN